MEAAVNAVVRDKNITEQSEVDAMAKAIEDAIAALQYKDADYTKVDAAIAKANALKKDDYKDFSGVEAAVNAVVRDKNITAVSYTHLGTVFRSVGLWDEHSAADRTAFQVLIPENLRFQRPVQRQNRPAEPLTADRERNRLRTGAGVPIVKNDAVAVLTAAALPAYQAGRLFPLRRCHAVKGTVRPAFQRWQVFIGVISHAFPPFFAFAVLPEKASCPIPAACSGVGTLPTASGQVLPK